MKSLLSTILALMIVTLIPYAAVAKDKATPKRELPVVAGQPVVESVVSTPNEVTVPVNLVRPEVAIDNAMSTPVKYNAENTGVAYSKNKAAEDQKAKLKKAEAIARKKDTYKKPVKRKSMRKNSVTYSEPVKQ